MKAKKGLQKFTETETKINKVLSLEQITFKELETLSEPEKDRLFETITEKFNNLKGTERDKFYEKIELLTSDTTKNQIWENNHIQITWAISTLIKEYGRIPSKTEIAAKTELSRQTIHKHFKEYSSHPQYLEQIEQFRFMASKVLARIYDFAVNGDIGAAKLYFNILGFLNNGKSTKNTLIQNQNNYIQINGMILSQEEIEHFTPEQLNTIETILKNALPQNEDLNAKSHNH